MFSYYFDLVILCMVDVSDILLCFHVCHSCTDEVVEGAGNLGSQALSGVYGVGRDVYNL